MSAYPHVGRHVITEMDSEQGKDVTYRLQGDLEHYTEVQSRSTPSITH